MADICVIGGGGYVGIVTAVGLATLGHRVVGVDLDDGRIDQLNAGDVPIHEADLPLALQKNLDSGRLSFTTDLRAAIQDRQFAFIAVGTPSQNDGDADLSQILHVTRELARSLTNHRTIVIKSTVPVDAVPKMREMLRASGTEGVDFDIVANPEFLREGQGLYDFLHPDRIVIGSDSLAARGRVLSLYAPLVGTDYAYPKIPVLETTLVAAQMIKYAANAFLATRISFINELAELCQRVGADVSEIVAGLGHDPRIGPSYLQAGLGFGGPCLEKDLRALIHLARSRTMNPYLLDSVLNRNDYQLSLIEKQVHGLVTDIAGKQIAVLGLSFKPGTNDVRNSRALLLSRRLHEQGAMIRAHDPVSIPEAMAHFAEFRYCHDPYEAAAQADLLLLLTAWPVYRGLDYARIARTMRVPAIFDVCGSLDPRITSVVGLRYVRFGRPVERVLSTDIAHGSDP